MTSIVSWISNEREFPTMWVVADSRLSIENMRNEPRPLFDCAAKLFSIRVVCVQPNNNGHYLEDIYYSTTIGMAYAGSALLGLNLYAFINYTLANMGSINNAKPSMKQISDHVNTAFNMLLSN